MADIFHEVEEDLRRDQAAAIWKKYGTYIIGLALVLVLAVAAHWGWKEYSTRQQLQASADFLNAAATKDITQREAAPILPTKVARFPADQRPRGSLPR